MSKETTKTLLPDFANSMKCKSLKRQAIVQQKKFKKKEKKTEKKKKKMEDLPKQVPKTIESMREADVTTVGDIHSEENQEDLYDVEHDEMGTYFEKLYEPKVFITFSDNPHRKTRIFGRELCRVIPNSCARYRSRSNVKQIVKTCCKLGFTDIVVVNEDMKEPNGLLVIHLPKGPTALFRLSNVKITPELKKNHKEISKHRPEVILNHFTTRLGHTVARMLACLFHYDPEFRGRRAVTFHNQRDYIFFKHHRYEFSSDQKVKLRELGPRFTLKLRSLQKGTFDSKTGDYEWIITGRRHDMETSRRKFFL